MPLKIHPLVFVYGTLKRGFQNHDVMVRAGGEFICCGATLERYPLVLDDFPYLLNLPERGHQVEGEIYRVNFVEGWNYLDELEEHPHLYERRLTDIAGDDGETYSAWVYFLSRTDSRLTALPPVRAYMARNTTIAREQD